MNRIKMVKKGVWFGRHGRHRGMRDLSIQQNREWLAGAAKRKRCLRMFDSVSEAFACKSYL